MDQSQGKGDDLGRSWSNNGPKVVPETANKTPKERLW